MSAALFLTLFLSLSSARATRTRLFSKPKAAPKRSTRSENFFRVHCWIVSDLQVAVFLGRADCVEELVADPASESWNIAPRANIDRALHMASRGVRDYLHKTHGAPPPPENELRRWLFVWRWAVKKRWCPVYEVLFRAGAEVRPDWRDDPYAFMVEEFRGPICGFTKGSGEL